MNVGAFVPSTPFLAKRIMKGVNSTTVIELGPGTGVFTREILRKLPENGRLICIESNETFFRLLQTKFTDRRLRLIHGNALDLKKILEKEGINKADCIISGLPLGNFRKELKMGILNQIAASLSEDGVYIQFEYLLAGMKAVKSVFPKIRLSYEILNVPPAFVMRCRR